MFLRVDESDLHKLEKEVNDYESLVETMGSMGVLRQLQPNHIRNFSRMYDFELSEAETIAFEAALRGLEIEETAVKIGLSSSTTTVSSTDKQRVEVEAMSAFQSFLNLLEQEAL